MEIKLPLYRKILVWYLFFGLLCFILVATLGSHLVYKQTFSKTSKQLINYSNFIASIYSNLYEKDSSNTKKKLSDEDLDYLCNVLDCEIWIINKNGKFLYHNTLFKQGTYNFDFDPVDFGTNSYTTGDFYGTFSTNMLTVYSPIAANFTTYGYVLIHKPITIISSDSEQILQNVYIIACIIFALSLLLLVLINHVIFQPLHKITTAANEYANGNLTYKINIYSKDEMGYLANTLNYMTTEINNMEETQKNFVANVSHDFRSPLTSIKGYIEAMLDGTIPPKFQEKYLKTVLNETKRLTKLTQSLLTLHSLDKKGQFLEFTSFDINQTIKNILSTFEGTCLKRHIIVDLTFSAKQLSVYADMEKIQQVLYNLIDNAIKFSNDNSSICIETYTKYEKAFISIKDSGIGIPKDSIKKIWDKFYKSDTSRGKDKKGTGLGLSIVREIIQSHNENIDVISTEGVGTEFIFTLPTKGS